MKKKAVTPQVKHEFFFCPAAKHYGGDRDHYWFVREDGYEQYHWPEGRPPKKVERLCRDHQKPQLVTPELLLKRFAAEMPGLKGAVGQDVWTYGNNRKEINKTFTLTGDGVTIKMVFYKPGPRKDRHSFDSLASGHTNFTTSQGVRTFDRTGVEDSFYVNLGDGVDGVRRKVIDQLKRVAERREAIKGMVPIPGLGWLVTPTTRADITAKLRAGKSHMFTPAGFGTGHELYSGRCRDRYDKRASVAAEEFFGVTPIWIREHDCD